MLAFALHGSTIAEDNAPGWIGGQMLIPLDGPHRRVIIGTWQTRAHWEAWHNDAAFTSTRRRLEGLEAEGREEWWHEVIEDIRRPAATPLGSGEIAA